MPDSKHTPLLPALPHGFIDSWTNNTTAQTGLVAIQGWVIDVPPPRAILIGLDGEILELARLGLPRPDVAAVHPEVSDSLLSGWSAEIDVSAKSFDDAQVSAWVLRADGALALLAEAPLRDVARSTGRPAGLHGHIDIRQDGGRNLAGRIQLQGWVVDEKGPPAAVFVSIDGHESALARLGGERPDVATAHPHLPGSHVSGWVAHIDLEPNVSESSSVVVRVVRTTGETATLAEVKLGDACWPLSAQGGLVGNLDVFGDSGPLPAGRLRIQGWIVDTSAPHLSVVVSIAGRPAKLARLGRPRRDVAAAFPDLVGAGTSGWEVMIEFEEGQDDGARVKVDVIRSNGEVVTYGQGRLREVGRPISYPQASLDPVAPAVFGGIDAPSGNGLVMPGRLEIIGWAVDTEASPIAVVVVIDGKGVALGKLGYSRPDEAMLYPDLPGSGTSGWAAHVDLSNVQRSTVEVSAWIARANGEFAQIGHMPMRILGGIQALAPTAPIVGNASSGQPRGANGPAQWQGIDERWFPIPRAQRQHAVVPADTHQRTDGRRITSEIHIPISPTPGFFTRVHYLAASLRRFGGMFAEAKIVVSVGDDNAGDDLYAINPWSRHYPLEWRWLNQEKFRAYHYFATAVERFCYDFSSDLVLMLDADTLVVGPLDDLFEEVVRRPALYGVVTYISPARGISSVASGDFWPALYRAAHLPPPRMVCEYPGWGVMDFPLSKDPSSRFTPPFFNLGFLCAPRQIMSEIGSHMYQEMAESDRFHQTVFRCQIALCLALERHNIPWRSLAPRFNFGNVPSLVDGFPADFEDVRLIHYFAGDDFVRDSDIGSTDGVGKLLPRRDLHPVNSRLRDALAEIHEVVLQERSSAT